MERRDWSLKLLRDLIYIDSLDSYEKADALVVWYDDNFKSNKIEDVSLELEDLQKLEEYFFKNIKFMKAQQDIAKVDLNNIKKMKSFLKN